VIEQQVLTETTSQDFNLAMRTAAKAALIFSLCFWSHALGASVSKLKVAICYPPENPPYVTLNTDGRFLGYDVDVWNRVYNNLRLRAMSSGDQAMMDLVGTESSPFIPMPFDHILVNLTSNNIDIGVCNVFVTADRAKTMDFSTPYIQTGIVAVTARQQEASFSVGEVLIQLVSSFNAWARLILLSLLYCGVFCAHLIWLSERGVNPAFHRSYGSGMIDGTWFALVTCSTVGYGDKVPATYLGKAIALSWIFLGTLLLCALYGAITSGLVVNDLAASQAVIKLEALPDDLKPYRLGTAMALAKRVGV
jgi:polar amino acid transport system substrate-binding protein